MTGILFGLTILSFITAVIICIANLEPNKPNRLAKEAACYVLGGLAASLAYELSKNF